MPRPALTAEQRALLGFANSSRGDRPIDTVAFGKLMLRPEYAELVRRDITDPAQWGGPADSAAFWDQFGSRFEDQAPLSPADLPATRTSSSKEGTYDTIRQPAFGGLPASERVEFRPSLLQRVKDAAAAVPGAISDVGYMGRSVAGSAAAPFRGLLARAFAPAPLDAVSGAAAQPKLTERSKRTGL